MLNEYVYCPRLCYLEFVQGEWKDSNDTEEGNYTHRRVDREKGKVGEERFEATSVSMESREEGISCRMDLLRGDDGEAIPVDYKKGDAPDLPEGAWEADRVQLCAQVIVIRANGMACRGGFVYYAGSKKKVWVEGDGHLVSRTREVLRSVRAMVAQGSIPSPLVFSRKCEKCSLASICLPDEINALNGVDGELRRLYPSRDDAIPVYVTGDGASIHIKAGRLEIIREGGTSSVPLNDISQLSLYGNVRITASVISEMLDRGIPILHLSYGGWYKGCTTGSNHKNVELRMAQYKAAMDEQRALDISKMMISGKIRNCRTMLRRNDNDLPKEILSKMGRLAESVLIADSQSSLLGIEGAAAQQYFGRFNSMLKTDSEFHMEGRNKRPPSDPINAVLSYLYGILAKEVFVTLNSVGFDPYLGFYHRPRYGKPALALDLMEEFRPIIADSTAITLFNNGEVKKIDFVDIGAGVSMRKEAKRTMIRGYERRMNTEIIHPLFEYRITYRRVLEVQARLLARHVQGEVREYTSFCTR
ncbi:MAG: CRISPR-associated endonuclease Cas1 [Euryarchaeota archaeon]|nr:CRISPR-associated endonuclease Cas1 [Euryarchaeota archaeon]